MLNRVKVMLFKVIKIGQNLDVNVEGFVEPVMSILL